MLNAIRNRLRTRPSRTETHVLPHDPLAQKKAPYAFPLWVNGQAQWVMDDFSAYVSEGFNLNAVIYSAVMYKAKNIAKARLRAYTGDPENPERLPGTHPLAQLVARPNPHQSWLEYQMQRVAFLNIAGNSYTWLDRPTRSGLPTALYNLRPDRVTIVPEAKGIKGYLYTPEGVTGQTRLPFLPQDVIHVKFPNPGDPLEGMGYGLSAFASFGQSGDVDNAITSFFKMFFERGALTSGILKLKETVDNDEITRIKDRWRDQYGGYENWGEIGVLDADAEYQRIGLTAKEMGFDTLDARNETRILGPLGVPPILIGTRAGLERSTFSNYEEARKACWEDTLIPEIDLFSADDEYYLRDEDGAFVAYDLSSVPALQQKRSEQIEGAYRMWSMGVPANQAFAEVGLAIEDVPGGDIAWLPTSVVPISTDSQAPAASADSDSAVEDDRAGGAAGKRRIPDKAPPLPKADSSTPAPAWSEEDKAQLWQKADSIARQHEPAFRRVARAQFTIDRDEILLLVEQTKRLSLRRKAMISWIDSLIPIESYLELAGDRWREAFLPQIKGVVQDGADQWIDAYGFSFGVRNLEAEQWFENYMLKFAQPITDTSASEIGKLLQLGTAEGWSIPDMQGALTDLFQQWMTGDVDAAAFAGERLPPYRTEMIARTETMRAYNAGSAAIYAENDVQFKQWLTTLDGRERESHAEADGQIVGIDEPFIVGGEQLMQPGDPAGSAAETINCRCVILPVLDKAEAEALQAEREAARAEADAIDAVIEQTVNPTGRERSDRLLTEDEFQRNLEAAGLDFKQFQQDVDAWADGAYHLMRDAQLKAGRGEPLSASEQEWLDRALNIMAGMNQMPEYEGELWRQFRVGSLADIKGGEVVAGGTVRWDTLYSWGLQDSSYFERSGQIFHLSRSTGGVRIEELALGGEREVLMPPGHTYRVISVTKRSDLPHDHHFFAAPYYDSYYVEIEEIG